MKRKLGIGIFVILILIGVGITIFPIISNLYADHNHSEVIREYQREVENTRDDVIQEEIAKAMEYNERLYSLVAGRNPFVEELAIQNESYYELLNIREDGVMSYLRIPKINVYLPIYHGTTDEVLSKGVGHLLNTSLPVGGPSTHTVISAHTAYPGAELFNDLDELEEGDLFYLYTLNQVLAYEIDQIKVVLPYETQDFQVMEKEDYVTLVTCTPYGINTHRLLVRGRRIEYESEAINIVQSVEKTGEKLDMTPYLILFGSVLSFIVLGIFKGLCHVYKKFVGGKR